MTVSDIANEIYVELGSPTSTSVNAISTWLRAKVGDLNNLIFENFVLTDNEIVDSAGTQINKEAAAILKKLYKVYDYEVSIRTHMNAISTDTILEVNDQGSSVKKINRSEVSKTLAALKKEEEISLKYLIQSYCQRLSSPSQIAGDDTAQGNYGNTVLDYRITI